MFFYPLQSLMSFAIKDEIRCAGGKLLKVAHQSKVTGTPMDVNLYLPQQYYSGATGGKKIPSVYFLAGLTCTPNNGSEKAFWQREADRYGFAMVFPDTSPRGDAVPDDPEGGWDFGKGAGFYVNATQAPYSTNFNMYQYVHSELPTALAEFFASKQRPEGVGAVDFEENVAISGHSMGGFGAISGFLKNPHRYKSCSAFAPIVDPTRTPWGVKALTNYLGADETAWREYDPCALISDVPYVAGKEILIHYGTKDQWMDPYLMPQRFVGLLPQSKWAGHVDVKMVDGFDHSYYFVSTFVPEHAAFHAKHLGLA